MESIGPSREGVKGITAKVKRVRDQRNLTLNC